MAEGRGGSAFGGDGEEGWEGGGGIFVVNVEVRGYVVRRVERRRCALLC